MILKSGQMLNHYSIHAWFKLLNLNQIVSVKNIQKLFMCNKIWDFAEFTAVLHWRVRALASNFIAPDAFLWVPELASSSTQLINLTLS